MMANARISLALVAALFGAGCDATGAETEGTSVGECVVHADCASLYGDAATACAVDGNGVGSCVCSGVLCGPSPMASTGSDSEDGTSGGVPTTSAGTVDPTGAEPTSGDDGESSGEETGEADTGVPAGDNPWILDHFADDPVLTGDFDDRTLVEMPRLVRDATGGNAKYAFTPRNEEGPDDKRVAFMNVSISDLVSHDRYGGGIGTSDNDPGVVMYISNVYIEPNWPQWEGYDSTNYDGIVLDGAAEFYAEDLTIVNWNADSAIDIKSDIAQFSRFTAEGGGNRTLRFWGTGPYYIAESSVDNPDRAILWFRRCDSASVYIYDSTFNGESEVPSNKVECEEGSSPEIVYLDVDPRTTGEMHPMFDR